MTLADLLSSARRSRFGLLLLTTIVGSCASDASSSRDGDISARDADNSGTTNQRDAATAGGGQGGGNSGAGDAAGTGGAAATGGMAGAAGGGSGSGASDAAARADAATSGVDAPTSALDAAGGSGAVDAAVVVPTERFSFFVTSLVAMRELSKSQDGFGGDLRFGKATGLEGADEICRTIAEKSMAGAGNKTWRAFLSASKGGPGGGPAHAIDRIGEGPWYDRRGRLFAMRKADLLGPRPKGDASLVNDFPNESGVGNHSPEGAVVDNHDTLTGSNAEGRYPADAERGYTCEDWTSRSTSAGRPQIGHSWPRNPDRPESGGQWIADHLAPGCGAGVNVGTSFLPNVVGGGGGYGGIYCFALTP